MTWTEHDDRLSFSNSDGSILEEDSFSFQNVDDMGEQTHSYVQKFKVEHDVAVFGGGQYQVPTQISNELIFFEFRMGFQN